MYFEIFIAQKINPHTARYAQFGINEQSITSKLFVENTLLVNCYIDVKIDDNDDRMQSYGVKIDIVYLLSHKSSFSSNM